MVRPLTLVLKQFLLDRGLLTAYTGGLSSYCLFLMVARYLQEQSSSWGDCGSLLLGFLDFYGNSFDPGATGISVGRRLYFSRQHYAQPIPALGTAEQMWALTQHDQPPLDSSSHSQLDSTIHESITADKRKPPRAHTHSGSQHHFHPQKQTPPPIMHTHVVASGRPCTFDPLFVEDPLNPQNNVGRNAFRIFQVKVRFKPKCCSSSFSTMVAILLSAREEGLTPGDVSKLSALASLC